MNRTAWIGGVILVYLFVALPLVLPFFIPPNHVGLPHRHDWELYKQANSPPKDNCPAGTTAIYIFNDDQTQLFLECLRSNTND